MLLEGKTVLVTGASAGIGRAASRIRNDDWVGQARALAARRQEAG